MKILVDAVFPEKIPQALKLSEFPSDEIVSLCPTSIDARIIKCSDHPGGARTAVYIMQLQLSDALVVVWDGKDMELINLAVDMDIPIFILYQNDTQLMGFRLNWEDDF